MPRDHDPPACFTHTKDCTMKLQVSIAMFVAFLLAAFLITPAHAQSFSTALRPLDFTLANSQPTYYPYIIARGADRLAIQNTPMAMRPYRPMHFYGNAVRRGYFRGGLAQTPVRNATALMLWR